VDIAACWIDLQPVWGKGQQRVGGAIHHVYERLPMPMRGLDSDNGSEFINHSLYDWCQRHAVNFTRGRLAVTVERQSARLRAALDLSLSPRQRRYWIVQLGSTLPGDPASRMLGPFMSQM
jgi:hypothetical protein